MECRKCAGGVALDGKRHCGRCLDRARNHNKQRREVLQAKGLCACGGKTPKGRRLCSTCADYHRKRSKEIYEQRLAVGACRRCGVPATVGRACFKCWVKARAVNRLGGARLTNDLLALWHNQSGKCAYTGLPLIPGPTVEVDHLIPVSRGGKHQADNLVWTLSTINLLKGERTAEEFIDDLPEIIGILRLVKRPNTGVK